MQNKIVTIKLEQNKLDELIKYYYDYSVPFTGEYIYFVAKKDGYIITVYKNTKHEYYKVTFQGENPELEASIFSNDINVNQKQKVTSKTEWVYTGNQIGSDEVGTGDLFGPIIVCAAYVSYEDVEYLTKLGINDSKKLTDEFILEIGPKLIKKIKYSNLCLYNEKYNNVYSNGLNMNKIKAIMHNEALNNVKEKIDVSDYKIIIDQFCDKKYFDEYIKNESNKINIDISETKAESKYPSVAVASMIARFSFLKKIEKINKKYDVEIPFGASSKVDEFAIKFIEKYGIEEFKKISKFNFKNIDRIINKN